MISIQLDLSDDRATGQKRPKLKAIGEKMTIRGGVGGSGLGNNSAAAWRKIAR